MTATVAIVARHRALKSLNVNVAVTLSGNYATPGEVLTAAQLGLYVIHGATGPGGAMVGGTTGYIVYPELSGTAWVGSSGGNAGYPQLTLRALDTGASSGAAFAELADGAYPSTITAKPIILSVWGRTN